MPTIPHHIGFIMDGNRRWAKQNGLPTFAGHKKGYENFKIITDYCFQLGIKIVSVYAFSTENWNRQPSEIKYIMRLIKHALTKEINKLHQKGIKVNILGLKTKLDEEMKKLIIHAENKTVKNTEGTLNLCFNYGGRAEIIEAIKKITQQKIDLKKISEKTFAEFLWTKNQPDPDMIVRTSGEMRLSGFLTWQSVYSELFFSPKMWPDFSPNDVDDIIADYNKRQRRFGGN